MDESTPLPVTESQPPDKGLSIRGLWQVFYEPTEFFAKIKDNPKVLVGWIVGVLLIVAFIFGSSDIMTGYQLEQMRASGQNIPDNFSVIYIKVASIIFGGLAFAILPLIYAGIAMFWGNFVFGGQASYKQLLSVSIYAMLIYCFGALLHLPMVLAKDSLMVSYSPAILVASQGMESVIYTALSKFGIFNIWEYFAFSIGVGTVYGFKNKNGYIIGLLTIGLISGLHVLFSWIGAGMLVNVGG